MNIVKSYGDSDKSLRSRLGAKSKDYGDYRFRKALSKGSDTKQCFKNLINFLGERQLYSAGRGARTQGHWETWVTC